MSRELDAKVAEKVLGWEFKEKNELPDSVYCLSGGELFYSKPGDPNGWTCFQCYEFPKFTADPAADYEALKHVREKWDWDGWEAFGKSMQAIWQERDKARAKRDPDMAGSGWWLTYEPGDYSKAALLALGESIG